MRVRVLSAGGDAAMSRAQLEEMSRDVASRLVARGFVPGSRVAVMGDTSLGIVVMVRAAMIAGFQISVLGPGGGTYEERLRGLRPDVIVAPADEPYIVPGRLPGGWIPAEELLDLDGRGHRSRTIQGVGDFQPERFRLVQFTSGTTDAPRPVTVTREALTANLEAIRARLRMSADDSIFCWLPLNHDMGLVGSVLLAEHLACDLTLCPPGRFLRHPSMWPEWLAKATPSYLPAPNSGWSLLLQRARAHELTAMRQSLETLRLAVTGGEPIDPSLCERLTHGDFAFIPRGGLIPAYGLAEATVGVSAAVPGEEPATILAGDQRIMSVGPALDGVSVSIRDRGKVLSDGEVGEIVVRGESLACEFREGLATGDEGFLIGANLFVTGRRKDLIKVHGRRVFPHEIERIAEASGLVRPGRAVAFSVPYRPAERVVLLVEPSGRQGEGDAVEDQVCRLVQRDLGIRLDRVGVVDRGFIPKTTSGKLRRGEARSRWLAIEVPGAAT